jgi:hypothetical protein
MEGVFISEAQVYQKLGMRFPLYEPSFYFSISSIKVFSQLLFLQEYEKWEEYLSGIILISKNYGNSTQGL